MACVTTKRGKMVIDFYDQHGKRRLKTLPKGTTKKEAAKQLHEILREVEHGAYLPNKGIPSFSQLADDWLEQKMANIREHTYKASECHVRRNLKPFFGKTKITRTNYSAVTKFVAHEISRGASPPHIRKSLVLLNGIMKYGVRQRLIYTNPVQEVEKPKGHSRYCDSDEMDVLRPNEIKSFLENVDDPKYEMLFMLALMSGARQGEILGLMWSDVDWYNSQLNIKRTLQRGKLYEPKTPTSRRRIDLGPTVIAQLREWRIRCPPSELDLVFPSDTGTPMEKNNLVRRHFEPSLRRAGLRKIRFHDLRHTYASLLIAQGEHPKYIQGQMGHSSISVTMDTYGHLMKVVNQESARRLDAAVFGRNGDKMETYDGRR